MAYNNPPSTQHSWPPLEHLPQAHKVHKTFLQWKKDAEATTTDHQQNGFPSPFAWVYVEGLDIPPNAILGGVDRNGPWYIARTFYEGSLELGRAGRHFKLGASISYHGRDRDIGTYEVLVEANSPTRWVYQTPPTPPQLTLSDIKLVVIIDDSASMEGPLWSEARDALAGAAELSRQKGGEGLDIYCLNGLQHRLDFRGESEVHEFFNSIVPEGQTPIGARLREILEIYVPRIEDPALHHKPVSILVITDGVPTDDPQPVIIEFASYLDRKNIPLHRLGIQFVQIGDDPDATEALRELDEQLGPVHGIRDMVSTTPFSSTAPCLRGDLVVGLVLEEINSNLGNRTRVAEQPHSARSPGSPAQIRASGSLVQSSYRTFSQWKSEAQITTADYQQNGFPSPVAWVYVEGPALPPNAIIGGVDRNRPWHIARTFYEGSIMLGRAARHLKLGASVSYNGKARDVGTYEVLVEANLPTRWVYQPPPRPPQLTLADIKLVVVIDDSSSMDGPLWTDARDALASVAELSRQNGGEGLDLYCLNSDERQRDLQSESGICQFFNNLIPEGQTPTGARLREVLDIYTPRIEDPALHHKPISILVITDGVPTDDLESVIIEFARRLDSRNVPLRQLGIQFVQIGDDPDATEALRELDDKLGPTHGIRDIVDTVPFNSSEPQLRGAVLVKIVLGAVNATLDSTRIR